MKALRIVFRRFVTPPLVVFAALIFLFEEMVWTQLTRLVGWVAARPALARMQAALQRWLAARGAYSAMALFLIPVAALVPFKLAALYLIGTGHFIDGLLIVIAAKLTGTAIAAHLFAVLRPKLETIAWFAQLLAWLHRTSARIHAALAAVPAWQATRNVVQRVKQVVLAPFRGPRRGWLGSRFAALRRARAPR